MDPVSEGEPQDRFSANLEAVDKAISFTKTKMLSTASTQFSPQEAAQLAVDYLFYDHQRKSLQLRKSELDPGRTRNSEGRTRDYYNVDVRNSTRTGELLNSLNIDANLSGIRSYLVNEAYGIRLETIAPGDQFDPLDEELDRERQGEVEAEALEKIANAIPDSGVSVEKPTIFAWMDPRFNGENDTPQA
ncbi:MAG: hypothetical protein Q7T54_00740 [Candidatus Levybacteria bacterium]|nr:hypothetical protein [Candidatus Levybacteria bacterium]